MKALHDGGLLIQGQSGSKGIAIGEVFVLNSKSRVVSPRNIEADKVEDHLLRFSRAKKVFEEELSQMSEELSEKNTAEIITTQLQIIRDPEVEKQVNEIVREKMLSVEFAIYQTFCEFIERLKESGSELFRQRIIDLEDIRDRFVNLVCDTENKKKIKKGSVIVVNEISPADLISYYESGIAALVMDRGGVTSHAAIIAQSLDIPCVVSTKEAVQMSSEAKNAIVDGTDGLLILNPGKTTLKEYKNRLKKDRRLFSLGLGKDVFETSDGQPFFLHANMEFEAEIEKISASKARGVGLLRTESLIFGKRLQNKPEEQEAFYSKVMEGVEGTVTIRLFDIGGDKGSMRVKNEPNPYLGWRGVRLLLDEEEILRCQLRALLKTAGKYPGRLRILIPMVTLLDEVRAVRKQIREVQEILRKEGHPVDDDISVGIMVEVPGVALMADQFAKEVDFFSVGTNDLTQYTLAVDRGNEYIFELFQHYNPAVLRLIHTAVKASRENGVDIAVCGELAADEVGAACLFGMGINELSMVPKSIDKIRNLLSSHAKKEFEDLAEKALGMTSAKEIQDLFNDWKHTE